MTAWPSTLPAPRADSAEWDIGKTAARFETDGAVAKQRVIATAAIDTLPLTFRCDSTQRDTLLDFYYGEGAEGGVWFDYSHPFTGTAGQARFLVGQEPKTRSVLRSKFDISVTLEFIG